MAGIKSKREFVTGILASLFAIGGLVFFLLGFSTGYYTYGEMNSHMVTLLLSVGIAEEIFSVYARNKWYGMFWTQLLSFAGIALLVAAAMLLVGDRVEGIGNCIITDYDSGHGGEEAIYYSLAGSVLMLLAAISNIVGNFGKTTIVRGN